MDRRINPEWEAWEDNHPGNCGDPACCLQNPHARYLPGGFVFDEDNYAQEPLAEWERELLGSDTYGILTVTYRDDRTREFKGIRPESVKDEDGFLVFENDYDDVFRVPRVDFYTFRYYGE